MKRFAIYRRSKRTKDLTLVLWPVVAADAHEARDSAQLVLRARGMSCKRLHAIERNAYNEREPGARMSAGTFATLYSRHDRPARPLPSANLSNVPARGDVPFPHVGARGDVV